MTGSPNGSEAPAPEAAVAADAGLRYSGDDRPGMRRIRRGRGFSYVGPDGETVGGRQRKRIEAMVIPPAWTDVWINPDPLGHILATGRDARGRKQYRYHPRWRALRDANKFDRLSEFGAALPGLRRRIDADLRSSGMPREKALALVVRLLDDTMIRIGNPEYVEANGSFGLTTMRPDHVEVDRSTIEFNFVGKSGLTHRVRLDDQRLARVINRSSELGGQELFAFRADDGSIIGIDSGAVNDYLAELTGHEVTSKDFRTWGGTCSAGAALVVAREPADDRAADQQILAAVDVAAQVLGNTRTVCRNCYVHPAVLEAHRRGSLQEHWRRARSSEHFDRAERMILSILQDE